MSKDKDRDIELVQAIETARNELDAAREVVRTLADELADVVDVIEPAIAEHTRRIRNARMASIDEIRHVTTGVREMREALLAPSTERMLAQGERLIKLLSDIEEFRVVGAMDAFIHAFYAPRGAETDHAETKTHC